MRRAGREGESIALVQGDLLPRDGDLADRPGEGEVIGHYADGTPVIRYAADEPLADMNGEVEAMALYAGQSAALVHDIPSASGLMPSLMNRSREALSDALSRLQGDSAPAPADR